MTKYDKVAKVVAPKKQRLAAAQAVYDKAMAALAVKQAQLKEVNIILIGISNTPRQKLTRVTVKLHTFIRNNYLVLVWIKYKYKED